MTLRGIPNTFYKLQFRSNLNGVDFIDFADGTSWNRSAILDAVLA